MHAQFGVKPFAIPEDRVHAQMDNCGYLLGTLAFHQQAGDGFFLVGQHHLSICNGGPKFLNCLIKHG